MRAIVLLTLFGITLSGLVACSGKSNNAANNAAQTAASAGGAMGNAAQGAAQNAGQAAGAMGNAAKGAVGGAMGAMTGKPNCGAVEAVWVNLNTKVYHEPGDPAYGTTKHGEYLCPSQAKAQGFRRAGGAHHKASSSSM
ncbi:MAG: hypothetical protein WAL67_16750 [Candidatus Cybelea sp.]